jgi:NAD(P)-dependent dehydrogenase (short-subunit alcohol dehydrogenase family)
MIPTTDAARAGTRVVGDGALVGAVVNAVGGLPAAAAAACIVPPIPPATPLAELSDERLTVDVADTLDTILVQVQHECDRLRGGGRLVFVLPHAPLMGASGSVAASAVVGGLLSMARTLAIELARDAVTVNTVALDAASPCSSALAAQLRTLLGPGGETVTGQEIYLTAGSDLGRLRP